MEGFKKLIKMKTGGSVSKEIAAYEKRERKTEEKEDLAQDKAIVKKAIAMHDKQEHEGEKTDLSKLKKGGRSKKEAGTVRKYKAGGKISGEAGASGDVSALVKTKPASKKAEAPSKAAVKTKGTGAKSTKPSGDLAAISAPPAAGPAAAAPSKAAVKPGMSGLDEVSALKRGGKC